MTLTQKLGDSVTHRIPLRWGKAAFEPGTDWGLIYTVKESIDDADEDAVIQKISGTGMTHSGSNALPTILPADTTALTAKTYYYDVQAQHLTTGEVRTVAQNKLILTRDITRGVTVAIPVITTEEPVFTGPAGASAYEVAVANGFVGTEEEWLASLQPSTTSNNVTISDTAPTDPESGDVWIDTNGWIVSYWEEFPMENPEEGGPTMDGWWVSRQPKPSEAGALVYGTGYLVYVDGGVEYTLVYTPTT